MTTQPLGERGTLLLALIAGLSINGSFSVLFSAIVPFSIFPLISLVLSVYCLHHHYRDRAMPDGFPSLAAASFLLGLLMYSAIIRVEYPVIGSNFIPAILMVVLVFWIGRKLKRLQSIGRDQDL
ncbi:YijD family membrane protein [Acerihabitans arboris]|uniref:YijD family membrane protein n=1 Tax=Acerihabitans arboris TaxID=2691583 RepID=A0A845SQM1_9GAMM|nr:YijD family membrane protein [Acerihabitans arboris]NDL64888.1 YijD family membrane protein [Acerihabitans arboris]